jgi:hypothetical protein
MLRSRDVSRRVWRLGRVSRRAWRLGQVRRRPLIRLFLVAFQCFFSRALSARIFPLTVGLGLRSLLNFGLFCDALFRRGPSLLCGQRGVLRRFTGFRWNPSTNRDPSISNARQSTGAS